MRLINIAVPILVTCILQSGFASAHGIAGNRYFPPTISVDDPYAAYETHAVIGRTPNIGLNNSNTNAGNVMTIGGGIEPFDGFGIAIDGLYRDPNANLTPQNTGFDNLYYNVKKELTINDEHEYAITFGVNGQLGGTGGSVAAGYTTYAPSIFYAKGFGDLPNELRLFKPLAITGVVGYQMSTDQSQPTALNWGFTLQYSFLYLNDHVQRTGWGEPWNRLVAVVEFPLQTCMSSICNGQVTGSVNPGLIWVGNNYNLSAEVVFPINNQSGHGVGMLFQIHKYFGK
jgi:hypothetical protein